MTTLQDEMAALNHRLDHKLDTLKRLRRLYKTIALYISYLCYLCLPLIALLFFHQLQTTTGVSLIVTVLISVLPLLAYCWCMFLRYDNRLKNGRNLKKELYLSFMNSTATQADAIYYHSRLMEEDFAYRELKPSNTNIGETIQTPDLGR